MLRRLVLLAAFAAAPALAQAPPPAPAPTPAPAPAPPPPSIAAPDSSGRMLRQVAPESAVAVLGTAVTEGDGKTTVGRIVDVLVDNSGAPVAAVLDIGGFLGVGSRHVAVDWSMLHFVPTAARGHVITTDLPPDQVRSAPEYKVAKPAAVVAPPAPGAAPPLAAAPPAPDATSQPKAVPQPAGTPPPPAAPPAQPSPP